MSLKRLFTGVAMYSLFSMVSCQEEDLSVNNGGAIVEETTIIGMVETPNGTKTELGDPTDGVTPVIWTEGDVIKVFSESGSADFTLTKGAGTSIADFTGSLAGTKTHAIYPAPFANDGNMTVTLPEYQNYIADNIAAAAYPTVATANADGTFAFKNLCGILKLQLTGTAKITQIVIKNNAILSGSGSIEMSDAPKLTMDNIGKKRIVLNCQTAATEMGVQLNEGTPTNFYIVVPPTVEGSFTIEVSSIEGIFVKTTQVNSANEFVRSKILNMPSLTYATDIVFGGINNNTTYSSSFIGGNWWSPVNAGYQGDVETDHVLYTTATYRTACPDGWRLPTKEDLNNLMNSGYNLDATGYYGNGGKGGVWFGENANAATIAAPLNCIWAPYTANSSNKEEKSFVYRSMNTPVAQMFANQTKIEVSSFEEGHGYPVRCVANTDNSDIISIKKRYKVTDATCSSVQPGNEITFSYDGIYDVNTHYHADWFNTVTPVTLTYTLEDGVGVDMDYIHYYSRSGNGNFGVVDIYLSTSTNDDAGFGPIFMTYDFELKAGDQKVIFKENQKGVKHVKFVIHQTTVSCAEMEFWKGEMTTIIPEGKAIIESATASSQQPGSGSIENSFDGNFESTYHTQWILDSDQGITTRLPVDITYTFKGDAGVDLDYIYYFTKLNTGTFGEVDIYFSTTTNDDAGYGAIALTHDFKQDGVSEILRLAATQKGVKHVKFHVRTGLNNHATCLEMEFWKNVN